MAGGVASGAAGSGRGYGLAQMLLLAGQGVVGLRQHRFHAAANRRLDDGRHGPFCQRGSGEVDVGLLLRRQKLQRHFRAEQGAAQIHQHHDPIITVDGLDGRHDLHRVGADRVVGIIHSTGGNDGYLILGHLERQLHDPICQLGTM